MSFQVSLTFSAISRRFSRISRSRVVCHITRNRSKLSLQISWPRITGPRTVVVWTAIAVVLRGTAAATMRRTRRIYGTIYAFQSCRSQSTRVDATSVRVGIVIRTTKMPVRYNDILGNQSPALSKSPSNHPSVRSPCRYECGGQKNFRCLMCGKAFSQSTHLKRHLESGVCIKYYH